MSVIFQNTTENDTSGHHSQCLPLSLLHDLLVSGDVNAQDATFDDSQSETVEILSFITIPTTKWRNSPLFSAPSYSLYELEHFV